MARRSRRKKQVVAEVKPAWIESLDQEGRGVAHVEGKAIFIDGALPGEQVLYQSEKVKPTFEVAKTIKVLKPSNQRATPKCPHFGVCGGCKLQHFEFSAQVAAKQRMLENNFAHIGKVKSVNVLPPLFGPAWGYRHKARLSVRHVYKKERVLVGFNEKGTRYVADMDTCEVLVPAVSALIKPLQDMIITLDLRDDTPQIEVAVGEDNVVVLIFRIMQALSNADAQVLKTFANTHNVQIWTQTKGPDTIKPFYPLGAPQLQYSLPEFNLRYPFKPNEFTQVNPQINQVMIRRAMQLLQPQAGEKVADFFCGIGNFSLPIARSGADVLGLEGLQNLVERANESATLNQINNVQFGVADLFKVTEESLAELGAFDKWLIDPPRDGAYELVQAITSAIAPNIIVYVSCNPATLARDAGVLVNDKAYTLRAAGVINMFPHTAHVESVALFEKNAD